MLSHCRFDLHFSWLMMLGIFSCAYWPFIYCLWKCLFNLCPLLIWVVFSVELWYILYNLDIKPFIRYMFCRYFLSFFRLSFFTLLIMSFDVYKVFNFNEVQFIWIFFCCSTLLVLKYLRDMLLNPRSQIFTLCFSF